MENRETPGRDLASAVALNCVGVGYGVQLFIDLPPISAIAVSASSSFSVSNWVTLPFYSTTTDELIEAPAPEKDKVTQS